MTNDRAIELLNRISDSQFDGPHGDERREALEMAVRALEGDGDTISRKAVMKEFADFVRKSNNSDFAPTPTWNDAVSLVGSIPSAQPEEVVPHKNYKYLSDYWCECGWHLGKKGDVKYCPDCGRKVKWNG